MSNGVKGPFESYLRHSSPLWKKTSIPAVSASNESPSCGTNITDTPTRVNNPFTISKPTIGVKPEFKSSKPKSSPHDKLNGIRFETPQLIASSPLATEIQPRHYIFAGCRTQDELIEARQVYKNLFEVSPSTNTLTSKSISQPLSARSHWSNATRDEPITKTQDADLRRLVGSRRANVSMSQSSTDIHTVSGEIGDLAAKSDLDAGDIPPRRAPAKTTKDCEPPPPLQKYFASDVQSSSKGKDISWRTQVVLPHSSPSSPSFSSSSLLSLPPRSLKFPVTIRVSPFFLRGLRNGCETGPGNTFAASLHDSDWIESPEPTSLRLRKNRQHNAKKDKPWSSNKTTTNSTSREKSEPLKKRSKTGCWTCRIRHKRCTEEKPVCSHCIRLNLKCDFSEDRPPYMTSSKLQMAKLHEIKMQTTEIKKCNLRQLCTSRQRKKSMKAKRE